MLLFHFCSNKRSARKGVWSWFRRDTNLVRGGVRLFMFLFEKGWRLLCSAGFLARDRSLFFLGPFLVLTLRRYACYDFVQFSLLVSISNTFSCLHYRVTVSWNNKTINWIFNHETCTCVCMALLSLFFWLFMSRGWLFDYIENRLHKAYIT